MAFKLVDSLKGFLDTARRSHSQSLVKSQFSYFFLRKSRFCSKSDENKSSPSPSDENKSSLSSKEENKSSPLSSHESKSSLPLNEEKVKELLKLSSPLKSSATLDIDNEMWATTPYPPGTVFRESELDDADENEVESVSDDSTKSVIMFPGQGNQFVGMGKNLMKYPSVVDMFETANNILNCDLKKICLNGPENLLNDTKYCQPATFVCSLASLEVLKDEKPWALNNCVATCGYSLGELTALVFAGCVNFETGLKLVKLRAKLMAECCKKNPGGMLTIFVGPRTALGEAFTDAISHCKEIGIENPVCATASYLYPNCKVIAGNKEALDFVAENASRYLIRRHSPLPVSGAFHTELMKEAGESFAEELKNVQLKKPVIKVYSNVTGTPYNSEKKIKKLLKKQIYSPVRWERTVHNLLPTRKGLSIPFIYECGPGSSLIATVHKINRKTIPTTYSVKL